MSQQVAVLFARKDSIYKTLPDCDVWDIERDARNWLGGAPVVAHPPCRAWASLRNWAKPRAGEKDLAHFAIEQIRKYGGVLEHPLRTTLWTAANLPRPGLRDEFGGWSLPLRQQWFGHRARKETLLYIVGCEPSEIPVMPMVLGDATHTVGLWSGRDRARCKPSIAKHEYESTPVEFAKWLVEVARRCRPPIRASCEAIER